MSEREQFATSRQHEEAWAKIHDLLAAGHWARAREIFDQAVSSQPSAAASHKANLRSLLGGLEVENIEKLMEKDNPILFRVIGERIVRAAKLGAHLVPNPDWP